MSFLDVLASFILPATQRHDANTAMLHYNSCGDALHIMPGLLPKQFHYCLVRTDDLLPNGLA